MALRRLLSQVKRHETQLRELSYLAAQPYRISQHARGGVQRLSSSIRMSALGRTNYSGRPACGLGDTKGSSSASYLRELVLRNDPEEVIRLFESQPSLHNNPSALAKYVKSLANVDKLDQSELLKTLHRGVSGGAYSQVDEESVGALSALRNVGKSSKDGVLGTESALLHMVLWCTLCALGLAFLLILVIGALIENRGLGLGLREHVQPTMESNTKFSDVKGLDEAKAELEKIVHYLRDPKHFTRRGGKLPKGVLLVGPSGTGKTMLARAIAGEAGVPFFSCSGSEFKEMAVDVGARRVRDIFAAANRWSPCIIFIDEIDAIGWRHNPKDQQDMKMTLDQLLYEIFKFNRNEGNIVIAATNFRKALVRRGWFDRRIDVPNPDVEGRRQILEAHMLKVLKAEDVDLMIIARGTLGFSGADLANLITIAAHKAEMDCSLAVSMADLEHAKDKIIMNGKEVKSPNRRKMIAYHEGGHTLVTLHTDGASPVDKVTIVPNREVLGMVSHLPKIDEIAMRPRFYISRRKRLNAQLDGLWKEVLAVLDVLMGGKVAEELIFGESIPGGSDSDLQNATEIARKIVTLSEAIKEVGELDRLWKKVLAKHNYDDNGKSVEEEVRELLERANNNAKIILTTHIKELHALANALLEHETLSGSQVNAVLAQMNSEQPVQSSSQSNAPPPSTDKAKGIVPVGS
ncbi:hypothetical protein RD792_016823 [Penstemon davidsonii]|uniref:AAA+ ATPase domain-containing protein n=1 Tax=Penstemon davidsonii TaxID=160366 RepID=A0ABR0CL79_9LAMI|nr:hypothetical protein RD792_016823 [Penstemon davidsonii]